MEAKEATPESLSTNLSSAILSLLSQIEDREVKSRMAQEDHQHCKSHLESLTRVLLKDLGHLKQDMSKVSEMWNQAYEHGFCRIMHEYAGEFQNFKKLQTSRFRVEQLYDMLMNWDLLQHLRDEDSSKKETATYSASLPSGLFLAISILDADRTGTDDHRSTCSSAILHRSRLPEAQGRHVVMKFTGERNNKKLSAKVMQSCISEVSSQIALFDECTPCNLSEVVVPLIETFDRLGNYLSDPTLDYSGQEPTKEIKPESDSDAHAGIDYWNPGQPMFLVPINADSLSADNAVTYLKLTDFDVQLGTDRTDILNIEQVYSKPSVASTTDQQFSAAYAEVQRLFSESPDSQDSLPSNATIRRILAERVDALHTMLLGVRSEVETLDSRDFGNDEQNKSVSPIPTVSDVPELSPDVESDRNTNVAEGSSRKRKGSPLLSSRHAPDEHSDHTGGVPTIDMT